MKRKDSFVALDGLRGVAALVVVIFHLQLTRSWNGMLFPSGFLAVDMFFMLSGFVVAYAYEERLREGMTWLRFAEVRAIRLYPLYILGCAFTLANVMAYALAANELWRLHDPAWALPFALLVVPDLTTDFDRWFRLNPPAWSLFFEWVYNLAYAALLPFLSDRVLAAVVLASFLALLWLCLINGGLVAPQMAGLIPSIMLRPLFGLASGVLLYRLWRRGVLPQTRWPALTPVILFLLTAAIPHDGSWTVALVRAALTVAIPIMVISGLNATPGLGTAATYRWLGSISYPLYALHWPIMVIMSPLRFGREVSPWLADTATGGVMVLVSWAALRWFDEPVREKLGATMRLWRAAG